MIRIALILIRIAWRLPYLVFIKLRRYQDINKYSLEERYEFIHTLSYKVQKKGRVHVICRGLENLPKQSGYFMTPNHQGLDDALTIFQTHERPIKAIVKKELTTVPIVGKVITMLEYIPIKRDNVRDSMKVIKKASNDIKAGQNIFVFPEGTRSRNKNNVSEFKAGTFKIAYHAKCPIVPVAILNSYQVFEKKSLKKVTVQIHYLPAIAYEEYCDLKSHDLARLVQDRIVAKIQEVEKTTTK